MLAVLVLGLGPSVEHAQAGTCGGVAYTGNPVTATECSAEFLKIMKANWTVAEQVQLQYEAQLAETQAGRSLAGSLMRARIAGGYLPRLQTIVGKAGMIGGAFTVGWYIGGGVNKFFGATGDVYDESAWNAAGNYELKCSSDVITWEWSQGSAPDGSEAGYYIAAPAGGNCQMSLDSTRRLWYADTWTAGQKAWVQGIFAAYGATVVTVNGVYKYGFISESDFWGKFAITTADGNPGSGVDYTSSPVGGSDSQLLNGARTEADRNPAFGDWVEWRLDPAAYPDPLEVTLPTIQPSETATAYRARLMAMGKLGSITITTTSDPDPRYGPGAALTSTPRPGTKVSIGASVEIMANPSTDTGLGDAPVPSQGGCEEFQVPGIDFGPLTGTGLGDKFPFASIAWLTNGLGNWVAQAQAPVVDIPVLGHQMHVDLSVVQPAVDVIRPVFAIVCTISLLFWLSTSVMGMGRPGGSGD